VQICAILVLIFGHAGLIYAKPLADDPAKVVNEYCLLDARGARIFSGEYENIRKLMAWGHDRDEPGWDCAKIISDYEVKEVKVSKDQANVLVRYHVVAFLCSESDLDLKKYVEDVEVNLIYISEKWKLSKYIVSPRIYVETAIKLLNGRILEFIETKSAVQAQIDKHSDAIKNLEIIKHSNNINIKMR